MINRVSLALLDQKENLEQRGTMVSKVQEDFLVQLVTLDREVPEVSLGLLDLQGPLVSLAQLEAEECLDQMAQEVRRDQLEAEVCWVPKVPRATLEELENLVLLDCKV